MKALTINRNSWHYKLSQALGNYEVKNLCSYVWTVIFNCLCMLGAVVGLLIFLGFLSTPIFMAVASYFGAEFNGRQIFLAVGISVFDLYLIMASVLHFWPEFRLWLWKKKNPNLTENDYYSERDSRERDRMNNPSFIKMMWKTFKEKTCYKLGVK